MDEDRHFEAVDNVVKRRELFGVEREAVDLRRDRHTFQAEFADRTFQFAQRRGAVKRRHMRQADKAAGIILLRAAPCSR